MRETPISPLRRRMIEDMTVRGFNEKTRNDYIRNIRRFAAFIGRSPDTATAEEARRFQLLLAEAGVSIGNRNRIMTGLRFLFRVTLRRPDLAAEIYQIRAPQKIPLVMSTDETRRLLAVGPNLKVRVLLSLAYGCGLRAGEVVRLRAGDIDSAQMILRVVQATGTAAALCHCNRLQRGPMHLEVIVDVRVNSCDTAVDGGPVGLGLRRGRFGIVAAENPTSARTPKARTERAEGRAESSRSKPPWAARVKDSKLALAPRVVVWRGPLFCPRSVHAAAASWGQARARCINL